jgi:hypothetical protein
MKRLLTLLCLLQLIVTLTANAATIPPGRYVLITEGDAAAPPFIVNITAEKDVTQLALEDDPAVTAIVEQIGNGFLFSFQQKTPKGDQLLQAFQFAGVLSDQDPTIRGDFAVAKFFPSSSAIWLGKFQLFPIDKKE